MVNHGHPATSPKVRLWRYLPILIIVGLAVHLLVPQIAALESSWSVVKGLTWWAVFLTMIAQTLSYLGSGFMLHTILSNNEQRLSIQRGALITMASYSIGLVAGGWVGGAAATYNWVHRESQDKDTAILAGTLPALLNNVVLVGVAIIGTAYLLLLHDLSKTQLIEFSVIVLLLGLMTGCVVIALRFPKPTTRFILWLASLWTTLLHKPYEPKNIVASVHNFILAWNSLQNGKWVRPVLGAIANTSFDILTLFFMFIAAGYNVSPGILLAGYGLPFILGKMAFLFPGGVGVVEGSMVALYESLKVPNEVSVVVILGYRLISFWLPTLLGFAAAAFLSSRSFETKRGTNDSTR